MDFPVCTNHAAGCEIFYKLDALPVTETTASKLWSGCYGGLNAITHVCLLLVCMHTGWVKNTAMDSVDSLLETEELINFKSGTDHSPDAGHCSTRWRIPRLQQ